MSAIVCIYAGPSAHRREDVDLVAEQRKEGKGGKEVEEGGGKEAEARAGGWRLTADGLTGWMFYHSQSSICSDLDCSGPVGKLKGREGWDHIRPVLPHLRPASKHEARRALCSEPSGSRETGTFKQKLKLLER